MRIKPAAAQDNVVSIINCKLQGALTIERLHIFNVPFNLIKRYDEYSSIDTPGKALKVNYQLKGIKFHSVLFMQRNPAITFSIILSLFSEESD